MMEFNREHIIAFTLVILFSIGLGYVMYQESLVCDELVILKDGQEIEATDTYPTEGGMFRIRRCEDHKWISIPVQDVKESLPLKK
jgi:hypothetical protein